jgi:hypothetical protein
MRAVPLLAPPKHVLCAIAPALMAVNPAVLEIEPRNLRRHSAPELRTAFSDSACALGSGNPPRGKDLQDPF